MGNATSDSSELAIFKARLNTRRAYGAGGIVILLIGSALLANLAMQPASATGSAYDHATVRFIALLIVFMTALATTAAVFAGLRLGSHGEAFGLPSGSIRALLAIGIMILFVVFGLPLTTPAAGPPTVMREVSVPADQLSTILAQNREQGFAVQVLDFGAASPPRQARVSVSTRPIRTSADLLDFNKQILTAVITLLTTVIGFYFGSRTTTDAIKEVEAQAASAVSDDLVISRREVEKDVAALKEELVAAAQKVDAALAEPEPADSEQSQERQIAHQRVEASRAAAEEQRDAIVTKLRALDETMTALTGTVTADLKKVYQRGAQDALAEIKDLLAQSRTIRAGYAADIERLLATTAKG